VTPPVIREPVIILGAPRSGTTLLYSALCRHPALWNVGGESHEILEGPLHPTRWCWTSNAVAAGALSTTALGELRDDFASNARRLDGSGAPEGAAIRLVEKTPKNALRIPFLRELFPDARFVVLRRDGRAAVSSLLSGWRAPGRYESYDVPAKLRIGGYSGGRWCFLLPPAWRELVDRPLVEVCAAQWRSAVDAIDAALPELRADGVVAELSYEDLVAQPAKVLRRVCQELALDWSNNIVDGDGELGVVNAVEAPAPDKWQAAASELEPVLHLLTPDPLSAGSLTPPPSAPFATAGT
jgi:hypothetical protein